MCEGMREGRSVCVWLLRLLRCVWLLRKTATPLHVLCGLACCCGWQLTHDQGLQPSAGGWACGLTAWGSRP